MPIRQHLSDHNSFDPAAIEAMSKAFEQTCIALHIFAGDTRGREVVAARVIDLARDGITDPAVITSRIKAESRQHP